jgi:hypothetical protein
VSPVWARSVPGAYQETARWESGASVAQSNEQSQCEVSSCRVSSNDHTRSPHLQHLRAIDMGAALLVEVRNALEYNERMGWPS